MNRKIIGIGFGLAVLLIAAAGWLIHGWWQEGMYGLGGGGGTDTWDVRTSTAGDVVQPAKTVRIHSRVAGDVKARSIWLGRPAYVDGSMEAEKTIRLDGGTVTGDVDGKRVVLSSPQRVWWGTTGAPRVEGNVQADHIVIESRQAVVEGSVGHPASVIDVAGTIRGDVEGSEIRLRSTARVEGDLRIHGQIVRMEPGAKVLGNWEMSGDQPLRILGVDGRTDEESGSGSWLSVWGERETHWEDHDSIGMATWEKVLLWIPALVGVVALAVLALAFRNRDVAQATQLLMEQPWRMLWHGLLSFLVAIPLIVLLSFTVIGIPVAFLVVVGLFLMAWVGWAGLANRVGTAVGFRAKGEWSPLVTVVVGAVILAHLIWVPMLGGFLIVGLLLLAVGCTITLWTPRWKERWNDWRQKRSQS